MSDRTEQLLDELVRLQVRDLRREAASQSAAIRELDALGFHPDRIASLLGTTTPTVRNDLTRAKTAAKKTAAKGRPKRPAAGAASRKDGDD